MLTLRDLVLHLARKQVVDARTYAAAEVKAKEATRLASSQIAENARLQNQLAAEHEQLARLVEEIRQKLDGLRSAVVDRDIPYELRTLRDAYALVGDLLTLAAPALVELAIGQAGPDVQEDRS